MAQDSDTDEDWADGGPLPQTDEDAETAEWEEDEEYDELSEGEAEDDVVMVCADTSSAFE